MNRDVPAVTDEQRRRLRSRGWILTGAGLLNLMPVAVWIQEDVLMGLVALALSVGALYVGRRWLLRSYG